MKEEKFEKVDILSASDDEASDKKHRHHHSSGEHHHHSHEYSSGEHHHHHHSHEYSSGEHHHHHSHEHSSGEHHHHHSHGYSSGTHSSHHIEKYNKVESYHYPQKKHKNHTFRTVVITVLCMLVVIAVAGGILLNTVLNKVNYSQPDLKVDPNFEEVVDIPEQNKQAHELAMETVKNLKPIIDENVINILLIGTDLGSNAQYYPRSDSMMILSINKNDNTLRLASLSRAVYVDIEGHRSGRLNSAYAYGGPDLLIDTIENNYKINIDNYVSVDFEAFKKIVDIFGNVKIYLTDDEARTISSSVNNSGIGNPMEYTGEGEYELDGEAALRYARLRYIDNDRTRTGRQRTLLSAIFEKSKTMTLKQLWAITEQVLPLLNTDMSKMNVFGYISNSASYMRWNVEQTVIPDKSSNLVLIDDSEVLIVDWVETITYSQGFFYPSH